MSQAKKSARIAVIGAGPAGLSAAWYLLQRGYYNVEVLEETDRVGGKCFSVKAGGRNFDLGAFTVTWGYPRTLELARATGVPIIPQPPRKVFDQSEAWVGSIMQGLRRKHSMLALGITSLRYMAVLWRHRRWLRTPGFAGIQDHPELSQSFGPWARERQLDALIDMFNLPVRDMGYGSLEDIPTVYVLKYLHFMNFLTLLLYTGGLLRRWPKRFRFGFESLWEALSLPMQVRRNTRIQAIRRSTGQGIDIQIEGETTARHYDALIISCPPDRLMAVMDCTDEERELFSQIRYTRYCTTLCEVEGMPAEIFNASDDFVAGHPWEMMRAWPDNPHATFYSMLDADNDEAAIVRNIETDLQSLYGASLTRVVEQHEWPYFPHVEQGALQAGYFDRLENLQGQRHCFYTGGLLAFETVENVVGYSHHLIHERFVV